MINIRYFFIVFLGLVLTLNSGAAQAITDEEVDLISQYESHFQALVKFYSNVEISADRIPVKPKEGSDAVFPESFRLFVREGGYAKIEAYLSYIDAQGEKQCSLKVFLHTPKGWYSFFRPKDDAPFVLTSLDKKNPVARWQEPVPFATAPFSAHAVSLDKYLINPSSPVRTYTVKEVVSRLTDRVENGVRVLTFRIRDPLSKLNFDLAYDLNWVVVRAEETIFPDNVEGVTDMDSLRENLATIVSSPRPLLRSTVEYEGESDGIPLIKKLTEATYSPEGTLEQKTVYEVTKIVPGPPPLEVFDPKQFLPPGSEVTLEKAQFSWGRIFCIVIGLALIAYGLWKKVSLSRSQTS